MPCLESCGCACSTASSQDQAPVHHRRGGQSDYRTVWVRLVDDGGQEGWGEAAPSKFYGETPETVLAALEVYATVLPADPSPPGRGREARLIDALHGNNSARAAISAALHDLAAKRLGVPVYRMWGLDGTKCPGSTFTIGIDTPERIKMKVKEAEQYPVLKVKLGTDRNDRAILTAIRETPPTRRSGSTPMPAGPASRPSSCSPMLEEFGVTVLEQPLDPGPRGPGRGHPPLPHPGHRRRELHRGRRYSRGWSARWTASTSSWPRPAACARRCG